ncbi:hypothetical protein SLS60_006459 [Paraconiothyrium brasiliense]|uniref:Uncharacterized protein n=1 Tax=Paraconiothyrium brasiliense TaxID=300254 RepID=A0ABR3RBQ4_9PLEO
MGVAGLLDVRDGLVMNVLRVGRDEEDGGGRVGLEVGGGGGVGLDVGGKGDEGLDVRDDDGVGLDVGELGGAGVDVGLMGVVGTGLDDEIGGMGLEDEGREGIGLGKEMGGIGLVVRIGGRTVVLKTGGEGRAVGILNVGTGGIGLDVEGIEGDGFDVYIGGIGLVVRPGGTMPVVFRTGGEGLTVGMLSDGRLRVGRLNVGSGSDDTGVLGLEDMGGTGLDVGKGGTTVELSAGGEGLTVGMLNVGKLNDGRPEVGVANVGIDMDGEIDGKGLVVGNGGTTVEFETVAEGLAVGRLSEGRLSDGKLNEGRLKDGKLSEGRLNDGKLSEGRLNDGRLSVGKGSVGTGLDDEISVEDLDVGNVGVRVELVTGSEGLTVGTVSVGKPVVLKLGGGGGGLKVGNVKVGSSG